MAKFRQSYIIKTATLFVLDWAIGIERFYFPYLKTFLVTFLPAFYICSWSQNQVYGGLMFWELS